MNFPNITVDLMWDGDDDAEHVVAYLYVDKDTRFRLQKTEEPTTTLSVSDIDRFIEKWLGISEKLFTSRRADYFAISKELVNAVAEMLEDESYDLKATNGECL